MNTNTHIRTCTLDDAPLVGELIYALRRELYPEEHIDLHDYQQRAAKALSHPHYIAYLLYHNQEPAAIISLNECCSTYASGAFGEIAEFYVKPSYRSRHYGEVLLEHVRNIGQQQQWRLIEVGAPAYHRWARTIAFYKKNGFEEVGPRLSLDLT